jgi:hypothetical protein
MEDMQKRIERGDLQLEKQEAIQVSSFYLGPSPLCTV